MLARQDPLHAPASRLRRLLALSALTLAWAAAAPAIASANLWVAANGTDSGYCSQANPCATLGHALSLAIKDDTIYVGPGTFTGHFAIDPSIDGLVLQGAGMHATTLSGGFDGSGSVFTIASGTTAELDDMTITGGVAPSGGGVENQGNVTLNRDEVALNEATGTQPDTGRGGGVDDSSNANAPVNGRTSGVTIADSVITHNRASLAGGGVYLGLGVLYRDLVDNNEVRWTPGTLNAVGGGVFGELATVTASTITANTVLDSAGNPVGAGGGLAVALSGTLTSDTIAGNTASQGGGYFTYPAAFGSESGVLLAANQGGNCNQSVTAQSSLEDDAEPCFTGGGGAPNITGANPHLGPLADNGGATETMAIASTSPAYDASTVCDGTDQRGVSWLQRGATRCDLGAYQVAAPTTYVANRSSGAVTAYATGAGGNTAPVLTLAGSATQLSSPSGVLTDANADVFVTDTATNAISEFAPEAAGNVAPIRRIAGSSTTLNAPEDIAEDAAGRLYVTNTASSTVAVFAAGASGNAAPLAVIAGSRTGLKNPTGIAIAPSGGDIAVANDSGTITTFAANASGNVAPKSILQSSALRSPRGLNFDPAGRLIVANQRLSTAAVFAAGASGIATPIQTISATGQPTGLDLDLSGNLFLADSSGNRVLQYAPGTTAPSAIISGSQTGLRNPTFLSELPPTPTPRLRITTRRTEPRARVLAHGIALRVDARRGLAFRDRVVVATAVARVGHRRLAASRATALRPGTTTLRLALTRRAPQLLARHRRTTITITVTTRDAGGTQRRRFTITSIG